MSALLTMKGVEVRRGSNPVLSSIAIEIAAGELVGLIGPNGAGKSTLLRAAVGLAAASAGTIHLGDMDVARADRRVIAKRAVLLPERAGLGSGLTVRDVVRTGRFAYVAPLGAEAAADHAAIDAAMRAVAVDALADRSFDTLSAGERKRVLLARCFAQEAPLLLLDEPTSTLDPARATALFAIVAERVRAGGGALIAIHDLALAAASCDRLIALGDGRIIAEGSPREVLASEAVRTLFAIDGRVEVDDDEVRVRIPRRGR
jgi:iron complex transport system ATP-binding protein